jgi:hypothetical protein
MSQIRTTADVYRLRLRVAGVEEAEFVPMNRLEDDVVPLRIRHLPACPLSTVVARCYEVGGIKREGITGSTCFCGVAKLEDGKGIPIMACQNAIAMAESMLDKATRERGVLQGCHMAYLRGVYVRSGLFRMETVDDDRIWSFLKGARVEYLKTLMLQHRIESPWECARQSLAALAKEGSAIASEEGAA